MIKVFCDVCGKEPDTDKDGFAFEGVITEVETFLNDKLEERHKLNKKNIQLCKGCYFTHISKLLKKCIK